MHKISLNEAATYLDVSKATLRNWDKDGGLVAKRNPINGYRMYDMDELIKLKSELSGNKEKSVFDASRNTTDSSKIKKIFSKLNSIIRNDESSSNLITRFDEITKLFFIKFYLEQKGSDNFSDFPVDSLSSYFQRLYEAAIKNAKIKIPKKYTKILLREKTLKKCMAELSQIKLSSMNFDIKGIAYEEAIKNTFDKSDNQQFFTPYQITQFMAKISNKFFGNFSCDPACGTGGFLIEMAKRKSALSLLGVEIDERLAWISALNLVMHGYANFDVIILNGAGSLGNGVEKYFNKIDCILTNPPFGSDCSDRKVLDRFILGNGKVSRRRGILFIEQSWNLLRENGFLAIVIDQSVLNSQNSIDVRTFILSKFNVLGVIDLPETSFLPYANVNTSILLLQKTSKKRTQTQTFFAKSENVGRKGNGDEDYEYLPSGEIRLNSDLNDIADDWNNFLEGKPICSSKCFIGKINEFDNPNLRLDYSFHHPYREQSKLLISKTRYKLFSLAEICYERNESFIPSEDIGSTLLFTGLANIEPNTGVARQIPTPTVSLKSAVKRYEPGDIVFSKMRPGLRKIAIMNFNEGGYVSSECSVFHVRTDEFGTFIIYPELLAELLRSDFVYGQIMTTVTGIGRPRIGSKDLRNVKIPIPPIDIQRQALVQMNNNKNMVEKIKEKVSQLENEVSAVEKKSMTDIVNLFVGV